MKCSNSIRRVVLITGLAYSAILSAETVPVSDSVEFGVPTDRVSACRKVGPAADRDCNRNIKIDKKGSNDLSNLYGAVVATKNEAGAGVNKNVPPGAMIACGGTASGLGGSDLDVAGCPGGFGLDFNPLENRGLAIAGSRAQIATAIDRIGPVVPVPAAVWLFGSGLIGLIGVARRKKHSTIGGIR